MKPIAVAVFPGGRRYYFSLDSGFGVTASLGGGSNLHFGGPFTSVLVAVAAMDRPNPEFPGGDLTGDVLHGAAATDGRNVLLPAGEVAGDVLHGAPVETGREPVGREIIHAGEDQPLTERLDLFALGIDYAMYHKRFWGRLNKNDFSPWHKLGGTFTSAPAAIGWAGSRIDVFGVGLDHAMYVRSYKGGLWKSAWLNIGGSFTSAATLVSREPKRLDIFARGADFTLRGNHTDGTNWFGWQNHGGELASAPVAVSWGPDRIDIFAIWKDGTLRHLWWDGRIWNEWETLDGNYSGEPAVAATAPGHLDVFVVDALPLRLRHHRFRDNTWSLPVEVPGGGVASPTVISTAENHLEVFGAGDDEIQISTWDGHSWSRKDVAAGTIRVPQHYQISVDFVRAIKTRALRNDTDAAMLSVAVGNEAARIKTQWIGEIGGGVGGPDSSQTNHLKIVPAVIVDLAEPMSFSYMVVNNGHAPQDKILVALENGGNSLSLAGSSSMQEDIAKGVVKFVSVKIIGAIGNSVPVVGSILVALQGWLAEKFTGVLFESCDGVVAVELRAMMGRDLFMLTDNGKKTVTAKTFHEGTDSPGNCGEKSQYEVTWSIKPL